MKRMIVLTILLYLPLPVLAMKGDALLDSCSKGEEYCRAYIQGAAEGVIVMMKFYEQPIPFCIPDGVDAYMLERAVVKSLKQQNPNELSKVRGPILVLQGLINEWPC